MEDVTPNLLKQIQDDFQNDFDKSEVIKQLYAKIRDGTATYVEANEYAIKVGELLANAYKTNLSSAVLPDGKMYYNIAERIVTPTMRKNYELITEVTQQIQTNLNIAARIGIKAIKPELNEDRISGIIEKVSNADVYDEVAWVLDEPIKNYSQSIVDDSIRENTEFHGKSGLKPKIIRKVSGKCCEWCRVVAGTYTYPDVPEEVYRRHQRCRCTVEYYPGNGKVQDVHTKKIRNTQRIEQSKEWENENEKKKIATKFKRTFNAVPQNRVVNKMRKNSEDWIETLTTEEKRSIQKYTLNEVKEEYKFYERLNAMLRGDYPENENLKYYSTIISDALKKSELNGNVICYRGLDINPIEGAKTGDYINLLQFTSTTIIPSRTFDKQVKMVIYAKKGSKGVAYIENISKKPNQREMLFDKDCIYRVLSNSKDLVEVEVI